MSQTLLDIGIVLLFVLIGGVFNAAEVSMISLREGQVRQLARTQGQRGRTLEVLVSNPATFLASVQIGVTFATMLSSAFGAATISDRFATWLMARGLADHVATPLALVSITLVLSLVSLVLGELAPKRLALQSAERIALVAAGPLTVLAKIFRPVVWLLSRASDAVVRLLRGDPNARGEAITEAELQSIVQSHQALTSLERRLIRDVFAADDTQIREVMVPRMQLELLPASASVSRGAKLALLHPHSRFPVMGRDADDIVGVVHIRDLLVPSHPLGRAASVGDISKPVASMPGTKSVLAAMQEMRHAGDYLAVVVDEYGGTDGIITLEDLIEEIVGEMDATGLDEPTSTHRGNSPRLIDAGLNLDDFSELTGIELPSGPYQTVAGFVIHRVGRIPKVGDAADFDGHRLSVAALQGRRVATVRLVRHVQEDGAAVPELDGGGR